MRASACPSVSFFHSSFTKGGDRPTWHELFVCAVAPSTTFGQRRFHTSRGWYVCEDGYTAAIFDRHLLYSSFAPPLPREGCQSGPCALPLAQHMFSCFFDAQTPIARATQALGPRQGQAAGVASHRGKYIRLSRRRHLAVRVRQPGRRTLITAMSAVSILNLKANRHHITGGANYVRGCKANTRAPLT